MRLRKMTWGRDTGFAVIVFVLAVLARGLLVPFSGMGHDSYAYFDAADTLLGGKVLYVDYKSLYGPSFVSIIALAVYLFGKSAATIKAVSILFDGLGVVVFFYLARKMANANAARFFSLLYGLTYLLLIANGSEGNDDPIFVFFMLLGVYLLFSEKLAASAVSLGVAVSLKLTPLLLAPLMLWYVYSRFGPGKTAAYAVTAAAAFSGILAPFYIKAGTAALYPYLSFSSLEIDGVGPLSLLKNTYLILAYVFTPGALHEKAFLRAAESVSGPLLLLLNAVLIPWLCWYNRNKSPEKGFLINAVTLVAVNLFFAKAFYSFYLLWLMPFLYLLCATMYERNYLGKVVQKKEVAGFVLVFFSAMVYATNYSYYGWGPSSALSRILIVLGIAAASYGAYLTTARFEAGFRRIWAVINVAYAMDVVVNANPLFLLKPAAAVFFTDTWIDNTGYYALEEPSFLNNALRYVYVLGDTLLMIFGFLLFLKFLYANFFGNQKDGSAKRRGMSQLKA